ncbi:unnamed protein product [Pleuronectes platessa]|uniref:Uncharacterized protein n=1 Tax=Pleuronectes platessa TaxID=8262 RepID=A0A9N7YW96_PLEPL|nr:unnamed protein product [Pleuronectes platessa]
MAAGATAQVRGQRGGMGLVAREGSAYKSKPVAHMGLFKLQICLPDCDCDRLAVAMGPLDVAPRLPVNAGPKFRSVIGLPSIVVVVVVVVVVVGAVGLNE